MADKKLSAGDVAIQILSHYAVPFVSAREEKVEVATQLIDQAITGATLRIQEDAAELEAENGRLRDAREILENLAHSQARNSGEESDRADKAEARLTAALEVLKAVEWRLLIGDYGYPTCPKCKQAKKHGHAPNCALDAVMNKGGATDGR